MNGTLLFALLLCAAVGWYAETKGHNGYGFFFLSLFITPIISLIIIWFLPNLTRGKIND